MLCGYYGYLYSFVICTDFHSTIDQHNSKNGRKQPRKHVKLLSDEEEEDGLENHFNQGNCYAMWYFCYI